ncbi:MAG: PAS domain S-box protein [Longimicrobiales bacterium]|nr:PAS domain S-box protein [Longimicrobiales bacterium]
MASLLGLLALVGWTVGSEALKALQVGRVPMAPSTALLFLLFGALTVRNRTPAARSERRLGAALAAAGTVVAAVLLVLSAAGVRLSIEHLWLPISGTVGGVPVGHMSPLTALTFVLAGVSYLLAVLPEGRWSAQAAFVLAVAVEVIAVILTAAYVFSQPILYGSGSIPPALNTSLGFLFLGGALLSVAAQGVWPPGPTALQPKPVYRLLVLLGLAAGMIILPAYFVFHGYEENFRREVEEQLLAVADLKVEQISSWREERIRDASAFYANPVFAALVDDALYRGSPGAAGQLRTWLEPIQATFQYLRISVLDSTGLPRLTVPDTGRQARDTEHSRTDALRVMETGQVTLEGFRRDSPGGPVHLTVVAPVVGAGGPARGAIVIRVDPETYLYPTIRRWPTPSRTAETLLVRRDGDDVLFLNDLRFRDDAALDLRIPLSSRSLPAARAILGTEGIVEGIDYRGEPVVAALRSVPGTDWHVVARVDIGEVYGPIRQRLGWTLLIVGLLFVGTAVALGFWWQRREKIYYRERARAEHRHSTLLQSIGDAVIATDLEGRVELVNPVAEQLTGWAEDEATGKPLGEVFRVIREDTREPVDAPAAEILREGGVAGLARSSILVARDGTERPVAESGAPVRDDDGQISGVILVFRDQTRERQARRVLAAREEKYRSLFNSIRDAIIVADTNRTIIDCNPAFVELFGYETQEAIGEPTSFLYASEEEYERMSARLRDVVDDPQVAETVRFRKKSGEVFPGETNAFYLRDAEGSVIGFIGLIRDVARRVEAARALEDSEARYRTLFEAAPVGIFQTRSDGQALAVNQAMAEILGFDSVERTVAYYTDLGRQLYLRPERRDALLALLREHGSVEGFEYEATRRDGTVIWIEMNARVTGSNPDGTFGIEGFAWDITDRKEAEAALRQEQEMLARTERIAHIGSWELDLTTGDVNWSDEMFRIFQLDPEKGAPSLEEHARFLGPDDMEQLEAAVRQAIEAGEPYELDVEVVRPDGTTRQVRAHGYPQMEAGGVGRLHGFIQDITVEQAQQQREEELRAQLAQSQKMESVGRLAGGVAHDFNNMLSVILGHVELVQDQLGEDDPLYGELDEVRQAAESSADLTRQLLAFAREQVVNPEILDLNQTVESLLKMLRRLIGENIELAWKPATRIGPVRIDPVQIDQVLTNLLVNARDAIEGVGRVVIETRGATIGNEGSATHAEAEPGEYVVLAVSDTGLGMDEAVARRVFDPFFTTKPAGQGTGLGLATVYGIVHQNDGFLTVDSEPGVGTTFEVYLPRCQDEAQSPERRPTVAGARDTGSETILVVEDQPAVLSLVEKILSRRGYRVLAAGAPGRAMELADEHAGAIHLLITDVIMPEMNGRELADRLSATYPELGILFMSGYAEDVIAERGVIEEGVFFIEKPFSAAQLATTVRRALGGR